MADISSPTATSTAVKSPPYLQGFLTEPQEKALRFDLKVILTMNKWKRKPYHKEEASAARCLRIWMIQLSFNIVCYNFSKKPRVPSKNGKRQYRLSSHLIPILFVFNLLFFGCSVMTFSTTWEMEKIPSLFLLKLLTNQKSSAIINAWTDVHMKGCEVIGWAYFQKWR